MPNSYCINGLAIAPWLVETRHGASLQAVANYEQARLEGGRDGFYR
ncbi:MAG: hypothetical protein RH949_17330 [Coleofasciculus sp. A1-SPW-01]